MRRLVPCLPLTRRNPIYIFLPAMTPELLWLLELVDDTWDFLALKFWGGSFLQNLSSLMGQRNSLETS